MSLDDWRVRPPVYITRECPVRRDEHACSVLAYECSACRVPLIPEVCAECRRKLSPEQMHNLVFRCAECSERGR